MYHQALRIGEPAEFIMPHTEAMEEPSLKFGSYRVRPSARELSCNGRMVQLGSRAFDLLVVLLRSQGKIVSKDEIVRHVWPSTTVDESNLRFQMATLRKAIGDERDRIKTIPGRGYLFTVSEQPLPPVEPDDYVPVDDRAAIVIIDHDATNREAIHRLLQPFHAKVRSFGSIKAFLESETLLAL